MHMGRFITLKVVPKTPRLCPPPIERENNKTFLEDGFHSLETTGPSLRGDEVTVCVPSGIGDIFWTYQKLSPLFNRINYKIAVSEANAVQLRAKDWLTWPKIGSVTFEMLSSERIGRICNGYFSVRRVMEQYQDGCREIDYSFNHWLEDGERIDGIDTTYPVAFDVPLEMEEWSLWSEYLVLYVSGTAKRRVIGSWSLEKWAELVSMYMDRTKKLPIWVIGAGFDREVSEHLVKMLRDQGFEARALVQATPGRVLYLLKHSQFFFGFQSGLNILADNLDVRQAMLYFGHLARMMPSWCKPGHLGTCYFPATFDATPAQVIQQVF